MGLIQSDHVMLTRNLIIVTNNIILSLMSLWKIYHLYYTYSTSSRNLKHFKQKMASFLNTILFEQLSSSINLNILGRDL